MSAMTQEERKRQTEERKRAMDIKAGRHLWNDMNPCLKEQDLSMKCLSDNNYDKDICSLHFENYNNCKSFWFKVEFERKKKGIFPSLPPANEREQAKMEYKHLMA